MHFFCFNFPLKGYVAMMMDAEDSSERILRVLIITHHYRQHQLRTLDNVYPLHRSANSQMRTVRSKRIENEKERTRMRSSSVRCIIPTHLFLGLIRPYALVSILSHWIAPGRLKLCSMLSLGMDAVRPYLERPPSYHNNDL